MRLVPDDTKVKLELFKGLRIWDITIILVAGLLSVYIIVSPLPLKLLFLLPVILLAFFLMNRLSDGERTYERILRKLRYLVLPKRFERVYSDDMLYEKVIGELGREFLDEYEKQNAAPEEEAPKKKRKKRPKRNIKEELGDVFNPVNMMDDLSAFTAISAGYIEYADLYFGSVLAIDPVEYRFMSEAERDDSIEAGLGAVLRLLPPDYCADIVKIDRPILYDDYLEGEYDKLEELRLSFEKNMINEAEYRVRVEIVYDRIRQLRTLCYNDKILFPTYYVCLFDPEKDQLADRTDKALEILTSHSLKVKKLDTRELAVFLKYTNGIDFEERDIYEIDPEDLTLWAMPEKVDVKPDHIKVGDMISYNYMVTAYPSLVDNAWMAKVMDIPSTKVVIKVKPVDREKALHDIDRTLEELKVKAGTSQKESRQVEVNASIDNLSGLLEVLQDENETLMEVSIYVTAYDAAASAEAMGIDSEYSSLYPKYDNLTETVHRIFRENGFDLNMMVHRQLDAYVGAQVSAYDPIERHSRAIPSNTIAAVYPWIRSSVSDIGGIMLGKQDTVPVFVDFFKQDEDRDNSNIIVAGKTGSGKSYAVKSLLTNLAGEDAKIFIIDPENEYATLADNLHGKVINAGNAALGRLNPFHILADLDDDEYGEGVGGAYSSHLQFLQEFFRVILPDCDSDSLEYLITLVEKAYAKKGISSDTKLSALSPEDYPVFDDVYTEIRREYERNNNDFLKTSLRGLINHISKFAEGGRNAEIWNGPSTMTTDSDLTVFNFEPMIAGRNEAVANAQMLLVLKYIDNEILKNRDKSVRYGLDRKSVVVIEKADIFMGTANTIALEHLYLLAKRIKKYNGMQIITMQNIKSFTLTEEIMLKTKALINECRYSLIFSLVESDTEDLCALYQVAGGINEQESEEIINAPRGQAFAILGHHLRSTFTVDAGQDVTDMFEKEGFESGYFIGRVGKEKWESLVKASRAKAVAFKDVEEIRILIEETEAVRGSDAKTHEEADTMQVAEEAAPAQPAVSSVTPVSGSADTGAMTDGERLMVMMMGQDNYNRMIDSIRDRIISDLQKEIKK